MDDGEFFFQDWLDPETRQRHQEYGALLHKLKLNWRASALNHAPAKVQEAPKGFKLLRRRYR